MISGPATATFESLVNIGVDIVKIDGGFVRNVLNEPADQEFIAAMVDLARHLGIELVVEWVGDSETADLMVDLGADYLQGYYIGRPQNPDQILTAQSSFEPNPTGSKNSSSGRSRYPLYLGLHRGQLGFEFVDLRDLFSLVRSCGLLRQPSDRSAGSVGSPA